MLSQEATNSERVSRLFEGDPRVHIPEVRWDLTTKRVLTMEFVQGVKVNSVPGLRSLGLNPKEVGDELSSIFSRMIFYCGEKRKRRLMMALDDAIALPACLPPPSRPFVTTYCSLSPPHARLSLCVCQASCTATPTPATCWCVARRRLRPRPAGEPGASTT